MSDGRLVRLFASPPPPLRGFSSSICPSDFLLFAWSWRLTWTSDIISGAKNEWKASMAVDALYLLCSFDLYRTGFVGSRWGGWERQQRRDKPRLKEMTSQMEEWHFLRFQMIIPMHYSDLWWIMGLQEDRLTEAAISDRWGLEFPGRGLFCFSPGFS